MGLNQKVMMKVLETKDKHKIMWLLDFFNPMRYYKVQTPKEQNIRSMYGDAYYQYKLFMQEWDTLFPLIKDIVEEHNTRSKGNIELKSYMWNTDMVRDDLDADLNIKSLASSTATIQKNLVVGVDTESYDYGDTNKDVVKPGLRLARSKKDGMMDDILRRNLLDYVCLNDEDSRKLVNCLKEVGFKKSISLDLILSGLSRDIFMLAPLQTQNHILELAKKDWEEGGLEKVFSKTKEYLFERFQDISGGLVPCDVEQLGMWGGSHRFVNVKKAREKIPLQRHSIYSRVKKGDLKGIKIRQYGMWQIEFDSILDHIAQFEAIYNSQKFEECNVYYLVSEAARFSGIKLEALKWMIEKGDVKIRNALIGGYGKVRVIPYQTVYALKRKYNKEE